MEKLNTDQLDAIFKIYFEEVEAIYNQKDYETELVYRPAVKRLLDDLMPGTTALNDAKRQSVGAPDFIILRKPEQSNQTMLIKEVPLAYVEHKKIGVDLDQKDNQAQLKRYLELGNVVHTDGLIFRFYFDKELVQEIKIAEYIDGRLFKDTATYWLLHDRLNDAITKYSNIKSPKTLAILMADKARAIKYAVAKALKHDITANEHTKLRQQYESFKNVLIHDLEQDEFADMYAQTIAYGMFAARYFDKSEKDFSRLEAAQLVPAANPFLQQFFRDIAAFETEDSITWVIDNLAVMFSKCSVKNIMNSSDNALNINKDPVIHFYETFLAEYDKDLRKKRGVYYTPTPIVDYIIRKVDDVLKKDFGLAQGLISTEEVEQKIIHKIRKAAKEKFRRVQVLDPAVGTGTFLNELIKYVHGSMVESGQQGNWKNYVKEDLLPSLHGFELLMAPYTISILKIGITLEKTGINTNKLNERINIYLTNTLEEPDKKLAFHKQTYIPTDTSAALALESQQASYIKVQKPIMIVMGNPPYSGVSSNETKYANKLIQKYKVEPGGKLKLQERKHWLNDDYVKFIAFAEDMIAKNGEGVVAMITNNGYLDNPTFRGMRWHLAKIFDKIYVLDLHGNSKKQEKAPDGSKDENVFDIQQGVAIILAVKTGEKKSDLAEVYHSEIFGTRKHKFNTLSEKIDWQKVVLDKKMLYFVPKDNKGQSDYEAGLKINDLFIVGTTGFVTGKDRIGIAISKIELENNLRFLLENDEHNIRNKFGLKEFDARDWTVKTAINDISESETTSIIKEADYRPFDARWAAYSGKSRGIFASPQLKVMRQFLAGENIGLMACKQQKISGFSHVLVHDKIVESSYVSNRTSEIGYSFPLFLYHDVVARTPNYDLVVLKDLLSEMGPYYYTPERSNRTEPPQDFWVTAVDVFDYVYGVLHSPSYRQKYKEFLKTDFPRVPKPKNTAEFAHYATLGRELRDLHLMNHPTLSDFVTTYPVDGDNIVQKVSYAQDATGSVDTPTGSVYINDTQFFGKVPLVAWNFYIGGYQPAQKWLKDRKERKLDYRDIEHYQKIIKVLVETDRIMKEIDKSH